MTPKTLSPDLLRQIDPNGGFLCMSMHWQPNPDDPDPERPGEKRSMLSYIPVSPEAPCLCGSGQPYGACCQSERYWHPVCPNPGLDGYSLLRPQSALFEAVEGPALRACLMDDERLHCVDGSEASSFWILWGDPALRDPYGILCFGDFELKHKRTLLVTSMSSARMRVQLRLLQETTQLDAPEIEYDRIPMVDKRTGTFRERRGPSVLGHRRRRR